MKHLRKVKKHLKNFDKICKKYLKGVRWWIPHIPKLLGSTKSKLQSKQAWGLMPLDWNRAQDTDLRPTAAEPQSLQLNQISLPPLGRTILFILHCQGLYGPPNPDRLQFKKSIRSSILPAPWQLSRVLKCVFYLTSRQAKCFYRGGGSSDHSEIVACRYHQFPLAGQPSQPSHDLYPTGSGHTSFATGKPIKCPRGFCTPLK